MKLLRLLLLAVTVICLAPGCVSEPGPEDTTVFGHIDAPKHGKEKKTKPQPIINEVPAGPVNATEAAGN